MADLRVLSWNLRGLRDDRAAVTRTVRELDPDVLCVQEAPKLVRWRARAAALARESGLLYVTGGGTTGGTALLAHLRVDVDDVREVPLSHRWARADRGVAAAVVTVGGTRVRVASLHLPLVTQARVRQAHEVARLARQEPDLPALVAGDVNERPDGPAWAVLDAAGLRDLGPGSGPTFPAGEATRRIDGAFGTADLEVLGYEVLDGPLVARASDHRPVLVTVRVGS